MICPKCQENCADDHAYKVHAIQTHGAPAGILNGDVIMGDPIAKPQGAELVPIQPPKMVNSAPVVMPQFDSPASVYVPTTDVHSRPKTPNTDTSAAPQPLPKADPQPIKLGYKYEGTCPDCLTPVTTLMLTVAKECHCTAICPSCLKQLQDHKVKPLE